MSHATAKALKQLAITADLLLLVGGMIAVCLFIWPWEGGAKAGPALLIIIPLYCLGNIGAILAREHILRLFTITVALLFNAPLLMLAWAAFQGMLAGESPPWLALPAPALVGLNLAAIWFNRPEGRPGHVVSPETLARLSRDPSPGASPPSESKTPR